MMLRPLELAIGLRYTRAKRRNHFISFISLTSMLGIALGVTALVTVLSVMNGFEKELRERILGMASHATITGYGGNLTHWESLASEVQQHKRVVGAAPYVEGQAMLVRGGNVYGAIIRGVLPAKEPSVADIERYMVRGSLSDLRPGEYGIVMGKTLAQGLGVGPGDQVTLMAPQAQVTPAGILPRLRRFTVVGLVEVGHAEYDMAFALLHIEDAARLFRLQGQVSGLRLKLDDIYAAPAVSRQLTNELGGHFWVRDWTQYHVNFFRALKTEKVVMFIILTLIVAVAAFNIVSTLIMVVTDKQSDIAILRTLGASPGSVMLIFVVQGTVIGLVGTLFGVLGGIGLATNVETIVPVIEQFFSVKFLSPDVYYISEVPSDMRWPDVVLISTTAFVMCTLATLYPAWRASRTQPAEALRYE